LALTFSVSFPPLLFPSSSSPLTRQPQHGGDGFTDSRDWKSSLLEQGKQRTTIGKHPSQRVYLYALSSLYLLSSSHPPHPHPQSPPHFSVSRRLLAPSPPRDANRLRTRASQPLHSSSTLTFLSFFPCFCLLLFLCIVTCTIGVPLIVTTQCRCPTSARQQADVRTRVFGLRTVATETSVAG
jgi:hypothetical protein